MADTVKISGLTEIASGALDDNSVVPVVDGGVTYKLPISKLKAFVGDSFATDTELSNQISVVNSTITGLNTGDISENGNLYYTNDRVDARIGSLAITSSAAVDLTATTNYISGIKTRLDAEGVVSSSNQISASAAAAGFSSGGGATIPNGTVSSSAQITDLGFISESITSLDGTNVLSSSAQVISYVNDVGLGNLSGSITSSQITNFSTDVSASAAAAGFGAAGAGDGGGSTDYVSNVTFSGTTLTFTGTGNAFNSTVDLSGESLATTTDIAGFVAASTYILDSSSFATRIDNLAGGGGGSVPAGTVSSSVQTIQHINTIGVVSSSNQIDAAQTDLSSLTTDDISEGITNRYYGNSLVLTYLNQLQVLSGSAGDGFSTGGTGIISASQQISDLNFVLQSALNTSASTLQSNIDAIQTVSLVDVNDFTATQKFRDIEVTGSIRLNAGAFSGSGAQLFGIPAAAIDGTVPVAASSLSDGDNSITANSIIGITINTPSGSILANGDIVIQSGSLISGSGAGLFNIPGSAIVGGVGGGTSIASGSVTASVDPNLGLIVNSDISASGDITARSISVGTSGTPTIYSNNNLNLSASNAVVITDSPLRLNPFTNLETSSFSLSNGDLVYNSSTHDFYGYKSGSWVSLTQTGTTGTSAAGVISSSVQIAALGAGIVSSSVQVTNKNTSAGEIFFSSPVKAISSSAALTYNVGSDTLTVGNLSTTDITYTGTLSSPANSTGSFSRLNATKLVINNSYELPISDGDANAFLQTDGVGNLSFSLVDFSTDIANIPNGLISSSLQLPDNLATTDASNDFSVNQVISASLYVTQSTITDVLVLPQRDTKPVSPEIGSIIVSASASGPRPFFYDGTAWFPMFA